EEEKEEKNPSIQVNFSLSRTPTFLRDAALKPFIFNEIFVIQILWWEEEIWNQPEQSMQRHSSEVARLYQTEFIRSARAVGMLWAVCTLCFAVIEVVILIQPSWVGTRELHYRGGGPAPPTGTLGLFEYITPNGMCVCGAGFCLVLACVLFPDSWACAEMRALCGEGVSSFSPGNCSVHWAYILAMLGVLDAGILATLAFVLGNRQDALLPEDTKDGDVTGLLLAA
ncbi:hypothetical protein cypCar_00037720, partial [Cyprinus carpio]